MTRYQSERQNTRRYRYRATVSVSRPLVRRKEASRPEVRQPVVVGSTRITLEQNGQRVALRRRVTMPHEAIQPLTWAERKQLYRQPRLSKPERPLLVSRTLSQTGHPAPVGQMRASRPLSRRGPGGSPVPVRRRQRRRGKSFLARLLGFMAVLTILIGGITFALTSSTFHIQQVTINGTQNAGLVSSIQHMGIQGQNIFMFDSTAMTARLEVLPLIASASMVVQLPNSIVINVRERTPVLLWQSGKSTYGISQDGMVIAPANAFKSVSGLVTVVDKRGNVRMQPGNRLASTGILFVEQVFQQLSDMQEVAPFTLQYIDQIKVGGRTEPANEAGRGSYVVSSGSGWIAYLGDERNSTSLAQRLQELQQILGIAREKHLKLATIDLRFGARPVYTLKP